MIPLRNDFQSAVEQEQTGIFEIICPPQARARLVAYGSILHCIAVAEGDELPRLPIFIWALLAVEIYLLPVSIEKPGVETGHIAVYVDQRLLVFVRRFLSIMPKFLEGKVQVVLQYPEIIFSRATPSLRL